MNDQTKKKPVLLAVILGAVALAVVIAAIIIVPKLANKGNTPDDVTTVKTPVTSAKPQQTSAKQETEPNGIFSVELNDNLKTDSYAIEIRKQIIEDLTLDDLTSDDNASDELVYSVASKTKITISSADDETCELIIHSIDVTALVEEVVDQIPNGLDYKEIREQTLQKALEIITSGNYKTFERVIVVPVKKNENAYELQYDFDFINAIFGGAFDELISKTEEGE